MSGNVYTSAVCGYLYSGSIESCGVEGGSVSGSNGSVGGVVGCSSSSITITSCYFIDSTDDTTTQGVGTVNGDGEVTYNDDMLLTSVQALDVVSTMNDALQAIDSEVKYTAGSPTDTNLPYLMGENLLYTGN